MINIVRETIIRHSMLQKGDSVAVGLSGGADSVSLLSALLELSEELELTIRAVHINHGIRGDAADRDEQFCRQLCEKLCVKLDCFTLDIPFLAAQRGIGLEQCGRECRYEHFDLIAREHDCKIATAHTLSDSAETVLFNLARGSGIAGVCGIPPVRGNVIRPLIGVTRAQVEEYCTCHGLDYVTDETNADTAYSRNLIRCQVIPALERVNPAMHRAVDRFTLCAREDSQFLDSLAAEELSKAQVTGGWNAGHITVLPPSLRRRAVILIAATRGIVPEFTQVELCLECIDRGSGAVVLRPGVRFSVNKGTIILDGREKPSAAAEQWSVPVSLPETTLPDGRKVVFTQIDLNVTDATRKNHKMLFKSALSCDIIKSNTSIRNRREGDRFAPVGRGVTKQLKKLLCDEGVPVERRGNLTIIASETGILWVEGFGASELGRPRPEENIVLVPVISENEDIMEDI